MKILLAPDSFKGTMTSLEIIKYIEEIAKKHFFPVEFVEVPIADGGEGTVEALVIALNGEYRNVEVTGPLGAPVKASFGIINKNTAVIEMAQASGLPLISTIQRNPLLATSYGTGEMIKAALDEGVRDIIIGLGGSATNDGGIGAAQAVGIRFLDAEGKDVGFGGAELARIKSISMKNIDSRIREANITVICDVNNPLTGTRGATAIFGPQKGATHEMLQELEAGMKNYAKVVYEHLGIDIDNITGAGAAGGLGGTLAGLFGAVMKPGIDTILDLVNFDRLLEGVDLVITGEGRMDGQSVMGKVPTGIAKHCKEKNISVAAIVGSMGPDAQKVYDYGVDSIITTVNAPMPLEEALSRSEELLKDAADRLLRMIKIGMNIKSIK